PQNRSSLSHRAQTSPPPKIVAIFSLFPIAGGVGAAFFCKWFRRSSRRPQQLLPPTLVDSDDEFQPTPFVSRHRTEASSRRQEAGFQRSKDPAVSGRDSGTHRAATDDMQHRFSKTEVLRLNWDERRPSTVVGEQAKEEGKEAARESVLENESMEEVSNLSVPSMRWLLEMTYACKKILDEWIAIGTR
ncbi:hypothetical protein LINGRAHAP2_LOCUS31962, partial [Linum grandiflorum]